MVRIHYVYILYVILPGGSERTEEGAIYIIKFGVCVYFIHTYIQLCGVELYRLTFIKNLHIQINPKKGPLTRFAAV